MKYILMLGLVLGGLACKLRVSESAAKADDGVKDLVMEPYQFRFSSSDNQVGPLAVKKVTVGGRTLRAADLGGRADWYVMPLPMTPAVVNAYLKIQADYILPNVPISIVVVQCDAYVMTTWSSDTSRNFTGVYNLDYSSCRKISSDGTVRQ